MEQIILDKIKDLLYRYSYAEYNDNYSSENYDYELNCLKLMLSPLITIANELNINLNGVTASYCGNTVCASDFGDMKEKLRYI